MEIQDIRYKIISKIDLNNFKDIISFLSIDTMSHNLSSQKYLWDYLLKEHNLPVSPNNFKKSVSWILEFKKIKNGYRRALSVLNKLENQQLVVPIEGRRGTLFRPGNADDINKAGLQVYIENCPIPDFFIVDGVDEETIKTFYNTYNESSFLSYLNDALYDSEFYIGLVYDKNFYLQIYENDMLTYKFNISKNSTLMILYNLLSHCIIPQNINSIKFPE